MTKQEIIKLALQKVEYRRNPLPPEIVDPSCIEANDDMVIAEMNNRAGHQIGQQVQTFLVGHRQIADHVDNDIAPLQIPKDRPDTYRKAAPSLLFCTEGIQANPRLLNLNLRRLANLHNLLGDLAATGLNSRGPGLHILKAIKLLLQNVDRKLDALKVGFALGLDGLLPEEQHLGNA